MTDIVANIYAKPWARIAENWKRLGIGNHPSPHDIAAYERFMFSALRGAEKPQAVLFGATPEIRDLVAAHPQIHLTVLDFNQEMITAMTSLMTRSAVNEECVVGDWLQPPLPTGTFDAVFGDQISCNVSFADQDRFYQNIHRLLKPCGFHIARITTRFPHTKIYTVDELVQKFSQLPPAKPTITEFWNILAFQTHHHPVSTTNYVFDQLKKHLDKPFMRDYYREFEEILPRGKEWNLGRPWEEEKNTIERYFEIVDQAPDDTFFKDSTAVFLLRSKPLS